MAAAPIVAVVSGCSRMNGSLGGNVPAFERRKTYDTTQPGRSNAGHIYGIETREELVQKSTELAARLGFPGMSFLNLSVAESTESDKLPATIDVVTALHAC